MKNWEEMKQSFENKKYQMEVKAKRVIQNTAEFVVKNKEAIAVTVPAVLGTIKVVDKTVNKIERKREIKAMQNLHDRMIYDRSLGMYWECKHNLSPNKRLEIEARKRNGEPMGQILKSMRLI